MTMSNKKGIKTTSNQMKGTNALGIAMPPFLSNWEICLLMFSFKMRELLFVV